MFPRIFSSTKFFNAGKGALCRGAMSMLYYGHKEEQIGMGKAFTKVNSMKVALCENEEDKKPLNKFNTKSTRLAVNEILVSIFYGISKFEFCFFACSQNSHFNILFIYFYLKIVSLCMYVCMYVSINV